LGLDVEDALRHYANVRALFDRRKLDSALVRFSRERIGRFERECRADCRNGLRNPASRDTRVA
jgi:hypothetical protein